MTGKGSWSIDTIRTTPCSNHLGEAVSRIGILQGNTNLTNFLSTKRLLLIHQPRLFLDADHLLRCGSRIHNAPLSEMMKFPPLLPPKHQLTSLILHSVHLRLFHAGTNATLTATRQKFWIPTASYTTDHRQVMTTPLCHLP